MVMQMNANQLTKIPVEKLSDTLRFLIAENETPLSDALKQVIDDVDAVCKKLLRDEQAPAQPVIPEQRQMVPDERPADSSNGNDAEAWFDEGWNACRAEMLKAQPVSEPYKLDGWISVADRLPSEFCCYLCYVEEQNDLGKSHYQWNCSWNGDVFSDSSLTGRVTHWMPLPAAPAQESE